MKGEREFRARMALAGVLFLTMVVVLDRLGNNEPAKALVVLASILLMFFVAPIRIVINHFREILSPTRRARLGKGGASLDDRGSSTGSSDEGGRKVRGRKLT